MTKELIDYHKTKMRLAEAEGRTEDYKFHKAAIEMLSQHTLPSNLDEAAEEYAEKHQSHDIYDCYGNPESDTIGKNLAFRAGAEWMAGRGASYNTKVGWIDGPTVLDWPDDILDKFEMGDEVIVQIRKRQWP